MEANIKNRANLPRRADGGAFKIENLGLLDRNLYGK